MAKRRKKQRQTCIDCGKHRCCDLHHEPPQSEGGTETIPLCKKCHTARHCANNDWARWGQRGGQKTGANWRNWTKNLKQYKQNPLLVCWIQYMEINYGDKT